MPDPIISDLTVNLLASGLSTGTKVSTNKIRSVLRQRGISSEIGDIATEFNRALEEAIEEENERRNSKILSEVTSDWQAIAEHLADTERAPDSAARYEREEIDLLFKNEEAAITRLADAIGAVNDDLDTAMNADPDVRTALEDALTRAYRRAVSEFERRIAADDELATVFEAETDLVLAERTKSLLDRLDTLQEDVSQLLTQAIRNEGFRHLSSAYFERVEPSPESCWRTTFTLADVHANIPALRTGHTEDTTAKTELKEALEAGENRLIVGRPGAGKSTLCKQVAVEWYRDVETGPVLYRESGRGDRMFESTGALSDAIDRAEGHILVVVEDAVREAANAILGVIEEYSGSETVTFLLDARGTDLEQFRANEITNRTHRRLSDQLNKLPRYSLPAITERDVNRVVGAFEEATGRTVNRDPSTLHAEIIEEDIEELGAFLLLSFYLPVGGETIDREGAETGLEAHVRSRYQTLEHPGSAGAVRDLSQFDSDLLVDVGAMVNLLNASGIGIHPEFVHALAFEYNNDIETHDEIADIRRELEGWFLYPAGGDEGPVRTTHELWSTLYLRELAREHADTQSKRRRRERSEQHVGRCLNALFALFEDEDHREALLQEFPNSPVLGSITENPELTTTLYVVSVFELAERWPILTPLFGTSETSRYELPETLSDDMVQWVVRVRGNAHSKHGAHTKALTEYERAVEYAKETGDKKDMALSLGNIGSVARALHDYETAQMSSQRALKIFREVGDRAGEAKTLDELGAIARQTGDFDAAQSYHKQSLDIEQDLSNRIGEAKTLGNLGAVAIDKGEYEAARDHLQEAVEIFRELDDKAGEAKSLNHLGVVATNLGEYETARNKHQQSLNICRDIGDRSNVANNLANLGKAAVGLDEYRTAIKYYQQSVEIFNEIGDKAGVVRSIASLGEIAHQAGAYELARESYETACDIFSMTEDMKSELQIRRNWILLEHEAGNRQEALEQCEAAFARINNSDRSFPEEEERIEDLRNDIQDG